MSFLDDFGLGTSKKEVTSSNVEVTNRESICKWIENEIARIEGTYVDDKGNKDPNYSTKMSVLKPATSEGVSNIRIFSVRSDGHLNLFLKCRNRKLYPFNEAFNGNHKEYDKNPITTEAAGIKDTDVDKFITLCKSLLAKYSDESYDLADSGLVYFDKVVLERAPDYMEDGKMKKGKVIKSRYDMVKLTNDSE